MKASVCIDAVCNGRDLSEALSLVKSSGIEAIEFWNWKRKNINVLAEELHRLELTTIAFCTVGGSLAAKEMHKEYIEGLRESVEVANRLGCKMLITTVGNELQGIAREQQVENVQAGLQLAAPIVEEAGITLIVEPLNVAVDHPGHLLSRSNEAFEIINEVNSTNVKLLFDIYHQQITEGNLITTLKSQLSNIGHIHAAGCPGRHELEYGEINYQNIFDALHFAGYSGYIGLEYFPSMNIKAGIEKAIKLIERDNL